MTARACLLCGGGPITREHVLPTWIAEHLGVTRLDVVDHRRPGTKRESVGTFGLTTRWFCKPCNEGWMNRIETGVQPWLKPLLLGKRQSISRVGQIAVSAWAWKTSLTSAATSKSRTATFDQDEYRRFRRTGEPPASGAFVWVGGFKRSNQQANLAEIETKLAAGDRHTSSIRVFTTSVGSVWLQTLVRHRHLYEDLQIVVNPDDAVFCVRIWPAGQKAVRPPVVAITQERFRELAERWQQSTLRRT